MSDISKEIDDIISTVTKKQADVPKAEKEAFGEAEEKPVEDPVVKNLQQEKEPAKEDEVEKTPVEETKDTQEKGDVVEPQEPHEPVTEKPSEPSEDPRILAMQETINQMSKMLLESGISPVAEQPKPVQLQQPQQSQPLPVEMNLDVSKFQILPEGTEFEDVVNDKATFEGFMRGLLTRYEEARVRRDTLAAPMLVSRQVQQVLSLREAVNEFYSENTDLVPVKRLVGVFARDITNEHPEWALPQVMTEAATRTRKALGRSAPATAVKPSATQNVVKPSFAQQGATRSSNQSPKKSKLQQEIEDIIA